MKLPGIILFLLIVVVIVLLMVNLTVSNLMSTGGISLDNIQTKLNSLQRQDTALEQKVLSLSSYTHIASAAATMGFAADKNTVALSAQVSTPLAFQQQFQQ